MRLSVLDTGTGPVGDKLINLPRNAAALEAFGYTRLWFTDNSQRFSVNACPELFIAQCAMTTTTMRLGVCGATLRLNTPRRILERYRLLSAMCQNRVDLGIAWGSPNEAYEAAVGHVVDNDKRLELFREFNAPPDELFRFGEVPLPKIYVPTSSTASIPFIAENDFALVFIHQTLEKTQEAVKLYCDECERHGTTPRCVLAVGVVCADTNEEALAIRADKTIFSVYDTSITDSYVVGSRDFVHGHLLDVSRKSRVNELLLMTPVFDQKKRMRSYELLAPKQPK